MRSYIYWVKRGLVLAGTISMIPAGIGMSHETDWNAYQDSSIRSEQQVKSKHGNTTMKNRRVRRGGIGNTHSIIFVGGKRTDKGSATKSNPKQARKVRGAFEPTADPAR